VKHPINHMALALKSTFGCLNRPFKASGATDHDALLQAPELMTVRAEQIFEKADSIAHRFRLSNLRMPPCTPPQFRPRPKPRTKPDSELTINSDLWSFLRRYHSGLSGLLRCSASRGWSARLDIDCLAGLYGLRGLLDREMQYALVEMSVDGSVLWLEWQGYRSVE
jgi:hypothetical protein